MKRAALLLAVALVVPELAGAQVAGSGSAVNKAGVSSKSLSAPSYTATASAGSNGLAFTNNQARLKLGTGPTAYFSSADGTSLNAATSLYLPSAGLLVLGTTGVNYIRGTDNTTVDVSSGHSTQGAVILSGGNSNSLAVQLRVGTVTGLAVGLAGTVTSVQIPTTASANLPTCNASTENRLVALQTASSSVRTRLCYCTSDNAASPAYTWQNLATSNLGTSTTCP